MRAGSPPVRSKTFEWALSLVLSIAFDFELPNFIIQDKFRRGAMSKFLIPPLGFFKSPAWPLEHDAWHIGNFSKRSLIAACNLTKFCNANRFSDDFSLLVFRGKRRKKTAHAAHFPGFKVEINKSERKCAHANKKGCFCLALSHCFADKKFCAALCARRRDAFE